MKRTTPPRIPTAQVTVESGEWDDDDPTIDEVAPFETELPTTRHYRRWVDQIGATAQALQKSKPN